MTPKQYDLVILGGGNSVTIAIAAGKQGLRTAVIEEGPLGGTCPNRGCIPSKLLIGYADRANAVRDAGRFHISAELGPIDGRALLAETFGATRKTDGKIAGALNENVDLYRARGRFVGERTLEADGVQMRGERVVIATGGRPRLVDAPGLAGTPYWTSRDVFEMEDLPRSIVIVGGGYIGCELAHFFDGVGVETTVLNRTDTLLAREDEQIRAVFKEGFTARVNTILSCNVSSVSHDGSQFSVRIEEAGGSTRELSCEALLMAVGRVPNTGDIGLEAAGVDTDEAGFIRTSAAFVTSAEGVYAIGDVIGGHQFTHSAALEAQHLEKFLLRAQGGDLDYGPMPHAVFSSPEIAGVGATEQELRAAGTEYHAAALPYTTAAKGRAIKEEHGLCKFLVAPSGEILGFHVVGEHASVLIHEVIPVMKWRNRIDSLTDIIHIHPSLSEVVRNTARRAAALVGQW